MTNSSCALSNPSLPIGPLTLAIILLVTGCSKPHQRTAEPAESEKRPETMETASERSAPSATSVSAFTQSHTHDNPQQHFMLEAVANTPYFALVRHTGVRVEPLPDSDPSDDFAEEKQIYSADVLTVFRGPTTATITYFMVAESGEETSVNSEPFLLSLCAAEEGLYWPGTGASFPATEENIALVRAAMATLPDAQSSYTHCE